MSAIVLYRGPSQINGSEIVVLATLDSKNRKTGAMIQTWILPVEGPLQASKDGTDDSVCGQCPRRRSLLRFPELAAAIGKVYGDCYVRLDAAPHSAWKKWIRDGSPDVNWDHHVIALQREARDHGLRLGAYGDPAAVPAEVWQNLISALQPTAITGYTHQWREEHASEFRTIVMASADTAQDASQAIEAGWRYFAAVPTAEDAAGLPNAIQCLSDAKGTSCEDCGICDGSRKDRAKQPTSVWIAEHGPMSSAKSKRSAMLTVLA